MWIFSIIYVLIIFTYISFRLHRETFIMSIQQEATSMAKSFSIIFVILFTFLQQWLLEKFSPKTVFIFNLLFISVFLCIFPYLPSFNFPPTNLFYKLLNDIPTLFFYITSELFATIVSSNFWIWFNSINKNKSSTTIIFAISQFSVITGSLFFMMNGSVITMVGALYLAIAFCFLLPDGLYQKKEFQLSLTWIPIASFLCGLVAGLIDPLCKYFLRTFSPKNFLNVLLPLMWILQSLLIMIVGFSVKYSVFWILPLSLCLLTSVFLTNNLFILTIITCITVLSFKVLKYSLYSPAKEQLLQLICSSNITLFDSIMSRLGKNSIAITLSIIFQSGQNWSTFYSTAVVIVLIIGTIWFIISIIMQRQLEKN